MAACNSFKDFIKDMLSVFGGRRKAGENAKECAIRELYEETRLAIDSNDLKQICELAYPEKNGKWTLCNYFLVKDIDPNEIDLCEGSNIEIWKPAEAIKQEDITTLPKLVIEKLC